MKKFCCYWEGALPPEYLAWCVSSWTKYVSMDEILFLNQSNVSRYLGDLIQIENLRRFSFAKQSDIVSAAFLYKYGGLFLDVDTVLVNQAAGDFFQEQDSADLFTFFGDDQTRGVHIGVIASPQHGTIVSAWQNQLFDRVANWELDQSWAYVGNSILEPLINSPENATFSRRLDVTDYLATPELQHSDLKDGSSREKYEYFWYRQVPLVETVQSVLDSPGGIISLHNSWTPTDFARLKLPQIMETQSIFAAVLSEVGVAEQVPRIQEKIYYGS